MFLSSIFPIKHLISMNRVPKENNIAVLSKPQVSSTQSNPWNWYTITCEGRLVVCHSVLWSILMTTTMHMDLCFERNTRTKFSTIFVSEKPKWRSCRVKLKAVNTDTMEVRTYYRVQSLSSQGRNSTRTNCG